VASLVPEAEEALLRILDDSASTAGYLDRLRAAGYAVEQVS